MPQMSNLSRDCLRHIRWGSGVAFRGELGFRWDQNPFPIISGGISLGFKFFFFFFFLQDWSPPPFFLLFSFSVCCKLERVIRLGSGREIPADGVRHKPELLLWLRRNSLPCLSLTLPVIPGYSQAVWVWDQGAFKVLHSNRCIQWLTTTLQCADLTITVPGHPA